MSLLNSYAVVTFIVFIYAGLLSKTCEAEYFPADMKLCKVGDLPCIRNSIEFVLRTYSKGYPDMGLIDISRVNLTDVVVSTASPDTPVQLNFKFVWMMVYGMENSTVHRIKGFGSDLSKTTFEVYITVPKMIIDGKYEGVGKVLLLPVSGTGRGHIEFSDLQMSFKFKCTERIGADGKAYAKMGKMISVIKPGNMVTQLDGLFNGNEELGNAMNKLINDNWMSIWDELRAGITNSMADSFRKMVTNVIDVVPYMELYAN